MQTNANGNAQSKDIEMELLIWMVKRSMIP